MYHNFYRRPFPYGRRFGGGFLVPFALGGIAGAAIARPNYYQPYPYYPYYPYYY